MWDCLEGGVGAQPSARHRARVLYMKLVLLILSLVVIINDGRHYTLEIFKERR